MLSSHSLFTRPAVVRASTLFRLLVLLDIVGAFSVANSKKKGKNTRLSACLSLSLSLSLSPSQLSLGQLNKEDTKKKTRRSSEKDTPTAKDLFFFFEAMSLQARFRSASRSPQKVCCFCGEVEEFVVVVVVVCIRIKPKVSVVRLPKKLKI